MEPFETQEPGLEPENTLEPVYTPQEAVEPAYSQERESAPQEPVQPKRGDYDSFPYTAPRKEKKRPAGGLRRAVSLVIVLALVIGSCCVTAGVVNSGWEKRADAMEEEFDSQLELMTELFNNKLEVLQEQIGNNGGSTGGTVTAVSGTADPGLVYDRNVDSVVLISSQITSSYYGQTTTGTATGSGFILTEDGYVVTNYHVVEGASAITVTTTDDAVYQATMVGYDDTNDVALLKVDATGLQAAKLGSSDALGIGDQVVAIGYPLSAQEPTLTVGYISAKNRDVTTSGVVINMLQTDAAINSGNSGGPLFNMNGEVIGITTAKYSGTTSSGASIEGIGFAIPVDDVTEILSDLMNYGFVNSAYLGVYVRDMTATEQAAAELYNFPVGAYVTEVMAGNCAEAAGVKAGDIIIELGGYDISGMTDLTRALRKFQGGDVTTITVFRTSTTKEITLSITLDQKTQPSTPQPSTPQPEATEPTFPGEMPENGSFEDWYDYFFGNKND